MTKLRVFVGFADEKLRVAMVLLLGSEHGMVIVGITDRLQGLAPQVDATQPDVLLLDWGLSSQSLANLITDIRNLGRPLKIVFLSNNPESEQDVLGAGADYFIAKTAPPDKLLLILHEQQSRLTEISTSNPK
ncbi:MAG: response regulator [Bacteroidota bacterium]